MAKGANNMTGRREHGLTDSSTHNIWMSMLARCRNPNDRRWDRYGGRGIKVCERWFNFQNFLADMGPRPQGLTLDRIDNDGHYEPSNCRWATAAEQFRNRSTTRLLTFNGKTQCIAAWAEEKGLKYATLSARLNMYKWPLEKALNTPCALR